MISRLLILLVCVSHRCCLSLSTPSSRRDFIDKSISIGTITAATTITSYPAFANEETLAAPSTSLSTPLSLPPLGLGAWAWGDSLFWGYDKKNDDDLKEVFDYALTQNLAFFDTAELYGLGRSEELIGKFRNEACKTQEDFEKVTIAS